MKSFPSDVSKPPGATIRDGTRDKFGASGPPPCVAVSRAQIGQAGLWRASTAIARSLARHEGARGRVVHGKKVRRYLTPAARSLKNHSSLTFVDGLQAHAWLGASMHVTSRAAWCVISMPCGSRQRPGIEHIEHQRRQTRSRAMFAGILSCRFACVCGVVFPFWA